MDFVMPNSFIIDGQLLLEDINPVPDVKELKSFTFQDEDCLIVSYPKTGSKWVATTLFAIIQHENLNKYVQEGPGSPLSPLEMARFQKTMDKIIQQSKPRVLCTHLWPRLLNDEIFTKNIKMICIFRNPKDVVVSYYEFAKMNPNLHSVDMSWDDFFQAFVRGQVPYGDYFEFHKQCMLYKENTNMLFIEYEEFLKKPVQVILKLAEYIGIELPLDQAKEIAKITAFQNMKENKNLNISMPLKKKTDAYLRSGVVGDWKKYMSEEQNEIISKKCELFTTETGQKFTFE